MCLFCLLYVAEDIFYTKMSKTKPICMRPECKREDIQWLHYILKAKVISPSSEEETIGAGTVNVIMVDKGWMTLEESWLDVEAAEDGDTFLSM
jgi:hypothetical protein